jgi:uncharacterized damage-inducible protein DinB
MTTKDPVYPIGRFKKPGKVDAKARAGYIQQIADTPALLRRAVERLADHQLDTPYREGGWTVRQVVHHLPDSHLNAYVRLKLALTEPGPTIKPYDESSWAELPEARTGPIALSLDLLEALHRRWVAAMKSLPPESFERTYQHPEMGTMALDEMLALYAWHGPHHVAQITALAEREAWS